MSQVGRVFDCIYSESSGRWIAYVDIPNEWRVGQVVVVTPNVAPADRERAITGEPVAWVRRWAPVYRMKDEIITKGRDLSTFPLGDTPLYAAPIPVEVAEPHVAESATASHELSDFLPCGHHKSDFINKAEPNAEPGFCGYCDMAQQRDDAVDMEEEYRARLAKVKQELRAAALSILLGAAPLNDAISTIPTNRLTALGKALRAISSDELLAQPKQGGS